MNQHDVNFNRSVAVTTELVLSGRIHYTNSKEISKAVIAFYDAFLDAELAILDHQIMNSTEV